MGHKTKANRQKEAVARNFLRNLNRELTILVGLVTLVKDGGCGITGTLRSSTILEIGWKLHSLSSESKSIMKNPELVRGTCLESYLPHGEGLDGHLRWILYQSSTLKTYVPHEGWLSGPSFGDREDVDDRVRLCLNT